VKAKGSSRRFNPYKNFRFRILFEGRIVAGVNKVSGLAKSKIAKHRQAEDPTGAVKAPGRTKFETITLERGMTHDPEFEEWASHSRDRRDIRIEVLDEAGKRVRTHQLYGCRVVEFQALPELDANANAVAIQLMKLEHEGWECAP